jgi:glycosyltransferase involved in cell wall biosynthesis
MRILILHDYGTLNGGAEHMSVTLRQGLRARGHDARLFTSTARPLPLEIVSDYTCYGTTGPGRRVLQALNPWAARRLPQVLERFRPDVVHVRMFHTQLSPLILPALSDYPTLLHVVNYNLICPLNTKTLPDGSPCHRRAGAACYETGCLPLLGVARTLVQDTLTQRWLDVFDRVVANSAWTQGRLQAEGIDVHDVVWNGVPVSEARPPLHDPPTVSFVGRLISKKGVDVLLRAMRQVVATLPEARLLVLGDGPEQYTLEHLAAALGLEASVDFLGHRPREEMEQLVAGAWVQAVPSVWEEPFGLVTAEALMRGTAVVTSNTGGTSEQVRAGETGLVVPSGDASALAEALLQILQDRSRAERMGHAGRQFALANLTEDHVVENFLALYHRLLHERDFSAQNLSASQ